MRGLTLVSHLERVVHHRLHDLFDVGRFGVARALVHLRLGRQLVRRVTCLWVMHFWARWMSVRAHALGGLAWPRCRCFARTHLKDVQSPTHVTTRKLEQSTATIFRQVDPAFASERFSPMVCQPVDSCHESRRAKGADFSCEMTWLRRFSTSICGKGANLPTHSGVSTRRPVRRGCLGTEQPSESDLPEASATRLNGGDDLVDVVADDAEADVLGILLDDCRRSHFVSALDCKRIFGEYGRNAPYRDEVPTVRPRSSCRLRRE